MKRRSTTIRIMVLILAIGFVGGCGMSDDQGQESQALSDDDHRVMQELVAGLSEGGPVIETTSFIEKSCLGSDQKNPQTKTRWEALLGTEKMTVPAARKSMSQLRQMIVGQGFEHTGDTDFPVPSDLFSNDRLSVTTKLESGAGRASVKTIVAAPCRDHPVSHLMKRDETDPHFGLSEEHYEDGSTSGAASS